MATSSAETVKVKFDCLFTATFLRHSVKEKNEKSTDPMVPPPQKEFLPSAVTDGKKKKFFCFFYIFTRLNSAKT